MAKATHWTACTAQREDGSFCDGPSISDAPFPICIRHAGQLYSFIRGRFDDVAADSNASLDVFVHLASRTNEQRGRNFDPAKAVVYYVQIGEHIKIGCTVNLKSRMAAYPPTRRLLATEPGYEAEEAQRHTEFAEYRDMGREWFRPGPDLVAHINKLRRKQRATPFQVPAA